MVQGLDRVEMVGLLNLLGQEDDAEVLSAARAIHARVTEAGTSWDDLLVPEPSSEDTAGEELLEEDDSSPTAQDEDDDRQERDAEDDGEEVEAASDRRASSRRTTDAQALKLINQLLDRREISKTLREELLGYKDDIEAREFDEADRNYLRALHRRLTRR